MRITQCADDFELGPAKREKLGLMVEKREASPIPADGDPAMPDAWSGGQARRQLCVHRASSRRSPRVVFSMQESVRYLRYAHDCGHGCRLIEDRPPRDATFVKRLREAGAIILPGEPREKMGTPNSRRSFGGRSATLTIRNAGPGPPAAAPEHRLPQTW